MSWSTIWELFKINILYSNPQTLSQLKKKQAKRPDKKIVAYRSLLSQQLMLVVLFGVIYLPTLLLVDFRDFPGLFSQYLGLFFVLSLTNGFSSLYTIFYDSMDLRLYAPLPVKSSEVYLAKLLSSFGTSFMFLLPVLDVLLVTYYRFLGPIGVGLALVVFLVFFVSFMTLALVINHLLGRLIIRSKRRKLFSTALMVLTTGLALVAILILNQGNSEQAVVDKSILPYFRGFYDLVARPLSLEALLNFYLPLVLVLLLDGLLIKRLIPNYYQEALYGAKKPQSSPSKKPPKNTSARGLLVRHHLSTLQNATLIVQAYLLPVLLPLASLLPTLTAKQELLAKLSGDYFGLLFEVGALLGALTAGPTSYMAVGLSLERSNYPIFKALPLNFKAFVRQKYLVLALAQFSLPVLAYMIFAWVVGLHPVNTLSLLLGFILTGLVAGQFAYHRDYRLLNLNWQDITQLYNRGAGQWASLVLFMACLFIGAFLIILTLIIGAVLGRVLTSICAVILILLVLIILQLCLKQWFWKKLD